MVMTLTKDQITRLHTHNLMYTLLPLVSEARLITSGKDTNTSAFHPVNVFRPKKKQDELYPTARGLVSKH